MPDSPIWVDRAEVLHLHRRSIERFGGSHGIRDEGLLESALQRPEHHAYYQPDLSLAMLAALYCHGIVKNHPFIDGNKRTGFLTAAMFLVVNGYSLTPPVGSAAPMIEQVAAGEASLENLAAWIGQHLVEDSSV
ncbi:MAG: type II toxin-antitoxin system death-on-curing family toxin [Rhodothermales bacterium]